VGKLRQPDGTTWELGPEEVLGRSRRCTVRCSDHEVSGVHAVLRYDGRWRVRDASSLNGTTVDGLRLEPGQEVTLAEGASVRLGAGPRFRLVDAGPPVPHLVDAEGHQHTGSEGFLAIDPGEDWVETDADGHWWLESRDGRRRVEDGEQLLTEGRAFTLRLPSGVPPTDRDGASAHVTQLHATFTVSRDEEHVEIGLAFGQRTWRLPSRVHHYTLLELARQRLADTAAGTAPSEAGWVDRDELLTRLKMSDNLLYTHLFRARRELSELGIVGAAEVIERRLDAGQLRIGWGELTVR